MKKCYNKCQECGREFQMNGRNKNYCSKKCYYQEYNKTRRKPYQKKEKELRKKECLYCKTIFETKNDEKNFCSRKCYRIYYWCKIRMKGKIGLCLYCKKEFQRTHGRQKYCSTKCYWTLYNQNHKQERKRYDDNSINLLNKTSSNCAFCNKKIYLSKSTIKKKNFCSTTCANRELAKEQKGENSYLWNGGKSFGQYGLAWTRQLRKMIRERDAYTCQLCNKHKTQLKKDLFVHHIDYMKINNFAFNLISLCNSCHTLTNHKRKYFKKFFQDYLADKYGYKYHHIAQGTINKWTEPNK